MKRKMVCVLLAAALLLGLLAPCASAAQEPMEGMYTFAYHSELNGADLTHDFYYSERFFDHPATEYDHELATATLGLAMAAFNTWESDPYHWVDGNVGREDNLEAAYKTLGFTDAQFYHYDVSQNTVEDYAAYGIARKTLTAPDGGTSTLVVLMVRGGGYGNEWVANLKPGEGNVHEGFAAAVPEIFASLRDYLAAASAREELGTVKLWMGGYSRGGALAGLLAARVAQELPEIGRENTFVYTFAAPAALTADCDAALRWDHDNNHNADGTLKEQWDTSNVFNLVGSGDIVTRVLPESWGFHRNGNDRYLPAVRVRAEVAELNAALADMGAEELDFGLLAASEDTDSLETVLASFCGSQSQFVAKYQDAMMDIMECVFTRTEKEVQDGEILSDEELLFWLSTMGHMEQFPIWTVARNLWLASSMSRPILEQLGENVPLRAQQIIIPILTVGLCYQLETSALEMLARYILSLVAVRGQADQFLQVAFWHFPEVYVALMEHYEPSAHGMEAYTRN